MISHPFAAGLLLSSAFYIMTPGYSVSETHLGKVPDDKSEPRIQKEYWCSLAGGSLHYEGREKYTEIEEDERRPELVTVPLSLRDAVVKEAFSEDGRFYSYVRYYSEQDDHEVLHGVLDMELERLSTSTSYLDPGKDGVLRPVSRTYAWSCTAKE